MITNPETFISDSPWKYQRDINGEVAGNIITENFENHPSVFVIPEPMSMYFAMIVWLREHLISGPEEDADGDGFSNSWEYLTGTNPTNAASHLSLSINGTNLTFAASSNCMYAVEWSENLSSSNDWKTLTNDVVGINGQLSVSDPAGATNRFYRLNARLRTE